MTVELEKSMKKACLCAINSKYIHSCPAVHSLAAYYEKNSSLRTWDITVKEYTINDAVGNILYDIVKEKPSLMGFSVYIWNVEVVKRLLSDLRAVLPETVVVLGGPEVSFGAEHCGIGDDMYDYIIQGEGELCFTELLSELGGGGWKNCNAGDSKVRIASRLLSMGEVPFVYGGEKINLFQNRIVYYETSRGCPYSCAYCLSGGDKAPVRFLEESTVFEHIDFFAKNKVPLVKFVDRTFNCNIARAKNIVRKIRDLPKDTVTCFHFEVGADLFDGEFLELLSELPQGRIQLEAGIQSTNSETLCASVRKTDNYRVFENLRSIMSHGNINVHTDLIAGLPFEGLESFKESFNNVYELGAHQLQLGFLKRLQGAPLCERQNDYGLVFSKLPPYEVLSTKWLSHDEIMELKAVEAALERYYNSGYYVNTLKYVFGETAFCEAFGSAYGFYYKLAMFLESRGELFASVSKRRAFDSLFEFLKGCFCQVLDDNAAEIMLLDYFATDKSELPPDSLKFLWRHSRAFRASEADVFKANGIEAFNGFGIRYIGGRAYIFDYNKKDPVTERFGYREAIAE